ncbi:MAG: transglutaminase domain-containing protein [Deltaproteobacteria bacterium]|nr:transglutaminase domain-containing protein [Deltaproteobacteria bacterium]
MEAFVEYLGGESGAGREAWYGVYLLGHKVGHARMWARRSAEGEPGAWAMGLDVDMRVLGAGREAAVHLEEARWYGGEAPGPLVETRLLQRTPDGAEERRAVATEAGLEIRRVDDPSPPRVLPSTAETLVGAIAATPLELDDLQVGASGRAVTFSWQSERDEAVEWEVKGIEQATRAGVATKVAELALRLPAMGLTTTTWMGDDGTLLEMSMGPGVKLRLEERDIARSDIEGLDVLGAVLRVERDLGDPRRVRELRLNVSGEVSSLPPSEGQRVVERPEGGLEVTLRAGQGDPVTDDERSAALASTGDIDAGAPTIAAKARELTADLSTAEQKVAALRRFVFGALEKRVATWVPSASAILAGGVGDCTEHSTLFIALCRAAGIPARPVYGVAYLGPGSRAFGYHAWAEVELDGRWASVDPTWDEPRADATHLVMGRDLASISLAISRRPDLAVVGDPVLADP